MHRRHLLAAVALIAAAGCGGGDHVDRTRVTEAVNAVGSAGRDAVACGTDEGCTLGAVSRTREAIVTAIAVLTEERQAASTCEARPMRDLQSALEELQRGLDSGGGAPGAQALSESASAELAACWT